MGSVANTAVIRLELLNRKTKRINSSQCDKQLTCEGDQSHAKLKAFNVFTQSLENQFESKMTKFADGTFLG